MTDKDERSALVPPARRPGRESPTANPSKAQSGGAKNKKIANGLVALGSAAIISVYGLGYAHTQSAGAYANSGAPIVSIATAAPTVTSAAASSPLPAYQSPLLAPTATAGTQNVATATSATATSAPTTAPVTAAKVPVTAAATATATKTATTAGYKDGTYTGTGSSPHGSITASVVVQGGKIVSANITQCGTRYPCSKIASLPGQVVARQSSAVDLVSGATDSSRAYQGAIKNALATAVAA
ncbi:MAG: FMN-binding protein [Thermomicrobiales bacterium]